MIALILAAGYGTRLSRDLEKDVGKYSHIVGLPKPLLPISGAPLITHWVRVLNRCKKVSGIAVVTNAKYFDQFVAWSQDFPMVKIVNDGSTCNEDRCGALGSIQLAILKLNIQDHLIVIGGDTLFLEDFSLPDMIIKFEEHIEKDTTASLVSVYTCNKEDTVKFGIVEIDKDDCIVSFLEKPHPSTTKSRLACPCFYIFSKSSLHILDKFFQAKKGCPLAERDATGHYIQYLSERSAVFTKEINGRFDVGGLQSYLECCQLFKPPV